MTQQAKNAIGETENKDRFFALKLFLSVALAFCAALIFRRSVGALSMTPLVFILCLAGAFIKINPVLKISVFALSVFSLNTIEQPDIRVSLSYSALCLLACVAFEFAVSKLKNKKGLGIVLCAASLAVCTAVSFVFIGNPIKAFEAQKTFDAYTEKNYPESEDAVLGNFDFTKVYYNYYTKAYTCDGASSKYPVEPASLTLSGNTVKDSLAPIMEEKIAEAYLTEIRTLLREKFPDDNFSVVYDGFAQFPEETLFTAAEGELYGSVNYIITLGGIQGAKEMLERAEDYLYAIDKSNVGYGRIVFRSGIGNWYRRSITVEGDHLIGMPNFELQKVRFTYSTEFNEYFSEQIKIK